MWSDILRETGRFLLTQNPSQLQFSLVDANLRCHLNGAVKLTGCNLRVNRVRQPDPLLTRFMVLVITRRPCVPSFRLPWRGLAWQLWPGETWGWFEMSDFYFAVKRKFIFRCPLRRRTRWLCRTAASPAENKASKQPSLSQKPSQSTKENPIQKQIISGLISKTTSAGLQDPPLFNSQDSIWTHCATRVIGWRCKCLHLNANVLSCQGWLPAIRKLPWKDLPLRVTTSFAP